MIKTIGYNRLIIIGALLVLGAGLFFYNYKILQPETKKQKAKLSAIQSESSEISSNVERLKNQLSTFDKEKIDFAKVQSLGFFDPQDRVETRRLITAIQEDSELVNARYAVKPAQSISSDKLRAAGYKILKTNIDFDLEALDDVDIYKFIYTLSYGFPGQVSIQNISFSRDVEVTQPLLRKIGSGQSEAIIKAKLNVDWQTMVPDESAKKTNENNQNNQGGAY